MVKTPRSKQKRPLRERIRRAARELHGQEEQQQELPKGTPEFFEYLEQEPVIEI
jgi:hypothetical protein